MADAAACPPVLPSLLLPPHPLSQPEEPLERPLLDAPGPALVCRHEARRHHVTTTLLVLGGIASIVVVAVVVVVVVAFVVGGIDRGIGGIVGEGSRRSISRISRIGHSIGRRPSSRHSISRRIRRRPSSRHSSRHSKRSSGSSCLGGFCRGQLHASLALLDGLKARGEEVALEPPGKG